MRRMVEVVKTRVARALGRCKFNDDDNKGLWKSAHERDSNKEEVHSARIQK